MARAFDFDGMTLRNARVRQFGRCGHCGVNLRNLEEHAHHVIPNQSGVGANPQHAWLKSVDNCIILCYMCHDRVHQDGRTRTGAVAPPEYFERSHGADLVAHKKWVQLLNSKLKTIWP
jgi:5-methylcytosine-specific restriction endonuclease McrA